MVSNGSKGGSEIFVDSGWCSDLEGHTAEHNVQHYHCHHNKQQQATCALSLTTFITTTTTTTTKAVCLDVTDKSLPAAIISTTATTSKGHKCYREIGAV